MSTFGDTFSKFFGNEIDEDQKVNLGNEIINDLAVLGFDFQEQRQILRGEIETKLPEGLVGKLVQYQSWTITETPDVDINSGRPLPAAYGDFEATGWMDR